MGLKQKTEAEQNILISLEVIYSSIAELKNLRFDDVALHFGFGVVCLFFAILIGLDRRFSHN